MDKAIHSITHTQTVIIKNGAIAIFQSMYAEGKTNSEMISWALTITLKLSPENKI